MEKTIKKEDDLDQEMVKTLKELNKRLEKMEKDKDKDVIAELKTVIKKIGTGAHIVVPAKFRQHKSKVTIYQQKEEETK